MTERGQLPKAYLRLDPNIDQTHPDNLDGFVRLLCAANRQPVRGQFRNRAVLDSIFGKSAVDKLVSRGDVTVSEMGVVEVPGWDVWQEGDLTVRERMRRYRGRHSTVTEPVTEPSPDHNGMSSRASPKAARQQGSKAVDALSGATAREDDDGYEGVVQWLASRKAWVDSPKIQTDLARLVDRKGAEAVIAAMESVPGAEDAAQFVYGARNILMPLPKTRDLERAERQDDDRKRHEAELARTRRIIEEDQRWRAS